MSVGAQQSQSPWCVREKHNLGLTAQSYLILSLMATGKVKIHMFSAKSNHDAVCKEEYIVLHPQAMYIPLEVSEVNLN